jgi:hypothetical protein
MYSLNSGIRRKIGQKREPLSNGGLLKQVAEKPREEFDRIQAASRQNDSDIVDDTKHGNDVTDSPDPISSLAPTNFTSRKPVKRSHAKFRERSGIDEMEDDLFLKDAPTITKSAVKLRSRQASVELRDRGYVKSLEVEPTPNFTGSGFLNALVAGKSTDEAAKEAQRKLLPDRTWAGYEKKRKPQRPTKGYGRSSANGTPVCRYMASIGFAIKFDVANFLSYSGNFFFAENKRWVDSFILHLQVRLATDF